ncbi:coiled-coil domain-containing protein 73 isoform X2 [Lethenteron reissneri]|uniref:coiled-coil domain-containing protein 73 isoform X2 n=1 Tax=Lethenteron reissneri TaxID=7753 RepID=UPI002AB7AB14|nr:coiled-coil domain-containing protein 73 isoform X2 [Lethenteron reissneri]
MDHTSSLVSAWTAMEQPHTCPRESPHGAHKVKVSQVEGEQTSDRLVNNGDLSCALRDPEQSLFNSVRQLHFKTSLLEMVEELRMRRESEHHFEEKFNQMITEKQELEWQKETLASKRESLLTEHLEEISKINKQFKSKLESLEAEKNKFQFLSEAAEREVNILKDKIKAQNLSVHSLEKRLADQDQKLQLHMLGRERVVSQLSEVVNLHSSISKQCETYRQTQDMLERNVQESLKLNKKLLYTNKHQGCIEEGLKQKLQQVSAELLQLKIDIRTKMEEKKREVIQRHHKLEEAQLQIQKEMDLGKLLSQTITALRQEKQETNKALEESQRLVERQSVHVNRTKEDNVALLQENQALKGDNEKLNGHMMEKDENCKSIKGRFENTKITLEEENRKQQLKLESLQLKYDSLQCSFQEIEESNCKFKSQVREQEGKIQGLQHSFNYQGDEKHMIESLESNLADRELEIHAFCKTNKEYSSKGTQSENQIPCTVSDTIKITDDEVLKNTDILIEEQKESEPRVNDVSCADACVTSDNPSDASAVLRASPQVSDAQEEKTETQSHVIKDCIAITNMETERHLNLLAPEKQFMADICEVTKEAELLNLLLQNTPVINSSENLRQQNVSNLQTNPTVSKHSVAMPESKEKSALSSEEQHENDNVIVSHEISEQGVLSEKNNADRTANIDIQLISAEASSRLATVEIADNVIENSTVPHRAPDCVSDALPLLTTSANEVIESFTSVSEGISNQLVTGHEESSTSVESGAAFVNLPILHLANIATEIATTYKQMCIALPDADSCASGVEICEQIRSMSTEVQPAVESDIVACEENTVADAPSTAEKHIDSHAFGDREIKGLSPKIKLASTVDEIVHQPSQSLEMVTHLPLEQVAVDCTGTNPETKGCAPTELPDQSPIALECSHIGEKYDEADGKISMLGQSITDDKHNVCSPTDAPKIVTTLSLREFRNVFSREPTSSSNTKSNSFLGKCIAKDPATETASVSSLTSFRATNPDYYSMYKHILSERKDTKTPTSHAQSCSPYLASTSNATQRDARVGDKKYWGGCGELSRAAPQIAQHKNTAAVTCSAAAHDTLTSPADGVTHQSTKSILRNNLWATSSSSSAAVKHQFNSGLPGNQPQGIFPGDVISGAKRKRDYSGEWNAIVEAFDVEQPSSKRESVGKKLHAASTLHATAPVCVHPGPSVGLKAKHNVTGVELVAFSDDEEDNWAIGNQITDIQKFLNVDRLKLAKK